MYRRYALYFAPEAGSDLARLGAGWLGRDAAGGPVDQVAPDLPGCREMAVLTASPRRYGLHGTLKPPMRLADGVTAEDFLAAARDWAATRAPVDLGPLVLGTLGRFLALVPAAQTAALEDFAGDLVRALDRFRAPLGAQDLARRRQHGLSDRQEALLAAWGYPYVMEELRFHVTLSDRLEEGEVPVLHAAAAAHFAPVIGRPHVMRHLAVFGEDDAGLFHQVSALPLQG